MIIMFPHIHTHSKQVSKCIGSRYDEGQQRWQQHGGGLFRTSGRVAIRTWAENTKENTQKQFRSVAGRNLTWARAHEFHGSSTCQPDSFKGRCCLPRGSVLRLALDSDGFKRVLHCELNHSAPHGLTVHRRHVAARRPTFWRALKLILFVDCDYIRALDQNLWRTRWKKDSEDRSALRKMQI